MTSKSSDPTPPGDDLVPVAANPTAPAEDPKPATEAAVSVPPVPTASGRPTVVVEHHSRGPGIMIRALWYIFIGWWLSGIVSVAAWFIGLTIIGLPLTFWIFNRLPTILTLRPRRTTLTATVDQAGNVHVVHRDHPQPAFWKRAAYFLLVGWWFSAVWIVIAWILSVLVLTIPLAVMMQNRLPAVTTLHRY